MKRYLILILAFLLVVKVFSCHLVESDTKGVSEDCPAVSHSREISKYEFDKFLETWSLYMREGYAQKVSDKISLAEGLPSENLPWILRYWLQRRCWDTDRFYYVEQRVRAVLSTSYLQKHTSEVAAILENQAENEDDEAKKEAYQDMLAIQSKIANVEGVSESELSFVKGREELIEQVLSGVVEYKINGNK